MDNSNNKELSQAELEKINGGANGNTTYVASVFRDGLDEDEVSGYYETQALALDAAMEKVSELLRMGADRLLVIKVYIYDFTTDTKQEVYSEDVVADDYYKKIN